MSALQAVDLVDFTGGANLRANVLQVGDSESPDMLNVEVEPGRGFYTRHGVQRWNAADITTPETWDPRHGISHPLSDGTFQIYIANGGTVWAAGTDGVFADLSIPCNAPGHLADFVSWGDTTYITCGNGLVSWGRDTGGVPNPLADASLNFNDNYTTPVMGAMPIAEHGAAHAGYLFVGHTSEGAGSDLHPNRVRWSHPNSPEDWATDDYLDIETGGGEITGLLSFQDHLLIFKTDSLWALYGYDLDSWQLVQLSRAIGTPTPTAIARSENACYFFSASNRSAIYEYNGNQITEISLNVRPVMDGVLATRYQDVWLGFVGRRLWASIPWASADPLTGNTIGVYDPDIGGGIWVSHRLGAGSMRSVLEGSDVDADLPFAVVAGDTGAAAVVTLDANTASADDYLLANGDATPFHAYYRTGWKFGSRPELRKSWLRTRFLAPRQLQTVAVRLDVYHDYDSGNVRRSLSGVTIEAGGDIFWRALGFDDPAGNGFDFKELGADDPDGRGVDFGVAPSGSDLGRTATSLGLARAVQLEFSTSEPGKPWGFDGIFMKVKLRRFTT